MKKVKKGLMATALSVSAAVALSSAAAMGATPQCEAPKAPEVKMSVGRITPLNLLSNPIGLSYKTPLAVTQLLPTVDCGYCSCLCGVRG